MREPDPIWANAPRLCPQRSFPAYRFVPGLNPHPEGNPYPNPGHLPPERWAENELYLFGVDLYHQGYLWESHEAWEALWHLTEKEDPEGQFLQGLIQNSAAQLKRHLGEISGARRLSQEAFRRLQFVRDSGVCDPAGRYMGLDINGLLKVLEEFEGPPPRLCLL